MKKPKSAQKTYDWQDAVKAFDKMTVPNQASAFRILFGKYFKGIGEKEGMIKDLIFNNPDVPMIERLVLHLSKQIREIEAEELREEFRQELESLQENLERQIENQ